MSDPLLELDGIHAGYEGRAMVKGIDMHVDEAEIVSLVGANGVGKSTTVKAICGIIPLMDGTIRFDGERIDTLEPHEIVSRGIVQVPERRELFDTMSVRENLLLGSQRKEAKAVRDERMEWVLDLFPRLDERLGQRARTMSGGEQQMLTIGRALMGVPEILVLDEPSLGLAPSILSEVFTVLEDIHESGVTVVIIEQNVSKALSLADRGYVMENGEIVMEGPGEELLDDDRVKQAYIGM
jgi:branched-chain amino acid transport system ATP-binding protein